MIRLHIICEGQTEEMFINEVLYDVFYSKGIYLYPTVIGKLGHKGGNMKYERLFPDLRNRLLSDTTSFCTTLFDFYGLHSGFPGKTDAIRKNDTASKANCLLNAFTERLRHDLGEEPLRRFIPYVQMFEFEGLLFSDTTNLAKAINKPHLSTCFQNIRSQFSTPEDINNSPIYAPSKRIMALDTEYDKPVSGSLAAIEIGIDTIRKECPLFNKWLENIETLQEIRYA